MILSFQIILQPTSVHQVEHVQRVKPIANDRFGGKFDFKSGVGIFQGNAKTVNFGTNLQSDQLNCFQSLRPGTLFDNLGW